MPDILVTDPIDEAGIEFFKAEATLHVKIGLKPSELLDAIGRYDALVVRSETKVTREVLEAGSRLQVVGRAGVGVDNIDLEAATQRGIAVVNAPTGNTTAAAEHAIALLMALARNIPEANAHLKQGRWTRSAYMGVEVRGKTLGIVGLGRVGSEVARRALGLDMRVMGHDPFVSPEYARTLNVEMVSKDTIFRESDFITLHVPGTEATQGLIGARELAKMKPSVRIINAARGDLIDEAALYQALKEDRVAGCALDVFSQEPPGAIPLFESPRVIVTPHIGASTFEAQAEVAREVAEQVLAVLKGRPARHTVNAPFLSPDVEPLVAPYLQAASYAGSIAVQLAEGQLHSIAITYEGELAQHDTAVLKAAALVGLLSPVSAERINLVNASLVASNRGLRVEERKVGSSSSQNYGDLLSVEVSTDKGKTLVSGTSMRNEPHIVRINDYWLDVVPSGGYMLFVHNQDSPGLIGAVGTIAGERDINISFMEVGRQAPRGMAMMVVGLDDPMPEEALEKIKAIPRIYSVKLVAL